MLFVLTTMSIYKADQFYKSSSNCLDDKLATICMIATTWKEFQCFLWSALGHCEAFSTGRPVGTVTQAAPGCKVSPGVKMDGLKAKGLEVATLKIHRKPVHAQLKG